MTLLIYPAGEQAAVIIEIRRSVRHEEIVLADDDPSKVGTSVLDAPIVGAFEEVLRETGDCEVIVSYGTSAIDRLEMIGRVEDTSAEFVQAVSSDAVVSPSATVGAGVVVNANVTIGPRAVLDAHVMVDSHTSVSHDASIGRATVVTPNVTICGGVSVGEACYLGPGAILTEGVHVADRVTVGAGAVVLDDVEPETTVVGVPARPIR